MRLVTFQDDNKRLRVGALAGDEKLADLTAACALYLRVGALAGDEKLADLTAACALYLREGENETA